MGIRKTQEEWDKEVYNLELGAYEFIEPYINSSTKIRVKHNICGNIYKTKPNQFLSGRRCPYCANKNRKTPTKRRTQKEWDRIVYEKVRDEYLFLDKYKNAKTALRVIHHPCGNEYKVSPQEFLRGSRCPLCVHKRTSEEQKTSSGEWERRVEEIGKGNYEFTEKYINKYTPIEIVHKICNNRYKVAPSDFIKGSQCPYCSRESRFKTQQKWDSEVFDLVGDEYMFLERYKGDSVKIKVRHKECGGCYKVKPNSFIYGRRCPLCKDSKGERLVKNFLKQQEIYFIPQKKFEGLEDKSLLSYDFYIPSLHTLIEYQGAQHYYPVDYFGGEKSFEKQVRHDEMKREFANNNGFTLIEIPFSVESMKDLRKFLEGKLQCKTR